MPKLCFSMWFIHLSKTVSVILIWHHDMFYQGLALSLKAISTLDNDWERFANTGCSWQRVDVAECGETKKPNRKIMSVFWNSLIHLGAGIKLQVGQCDISLKFPIGYLYYASSCSAYEKWSICSEKGKHFKAFIHPQTTTKTYCQYR